jgi:hypothetical protein
MIKNISIILFVFFMGYACYDYGYKTAYNKQAVSYVKQLKEQEFKLQESQKNITLIQLEKENEIKTINTKHSSIVNSLRNRPERTVIVQSTSSDSPTISSGAGSTGEQLFREDAEFLIGEAAKAETLKKSLASCRRYLLGNEL